MIIQFGKHYWDLKKEKLEKYIFCIFILPTTQSYIHRFITFFIEEKSNISFCFLLEATFLSYSDICLHNVWHGCQALAFPWFLRYLVRLSYLHMYYALRLYKQQVVSIFLLYKYLISMYVTPTLGQEISEKNVRAQIYL